MAHTLKELFDVLYDISTPLSGSPGHPDYVVISQVLAETLLYHNYMSTIITSSSCCSPSYLNPHNDGLRTP